MQLILQSPAPDYPSWKTAFDSTAEARRDAGLSLLQLWRDADQPAVFALFEVTDRKRAQKWLAKEAALGATATAHFVETT